MQQRTVLRAQNIQKVAREATNHPCCGLAVLAAGFFANAILRESRSRLYADATSGWPLLFRNSFRNATACASWRPASQRADSSSQDLNLS